jgi:hypothetical protein
VSTGDSDLEVRFDASDDNSQIHGGAKSTLTDSEKERLKAEKPKPWYKEYVGATNPSSGTSSSEVSSSTESPPWTKRS